MIIEFSCIRCLRFVKKSLFFRMKKHREEEINKYTTLISQLQQQCNELQRQTREMQLKLEPLNWEMKHGYFSCFDDILPKQLTMICLSYVNHSYCIVCDSLYYGKACIKCSKNVVGKFEFQIESHIEDMKCSHGCFKAIAENDIEIIQYLRIFHPDTTCGEHKEDFYFQVAQTCESHKGIQQGLHLPWKYLVLKHPQSVFHKPHFLLMQLNEYASNDWSVDNYPNHRF